MQSHSKVKDEEEEEDDHNNDKDNNKANTEDNDDKDHKKTTLFLCYYPHTLQGLVVSCIWNLSCKFSQ